MELLSSFYQAFIKENKENTTPNSIWQKFFFAYVCNIIGRTPVFGEIYWEENDIILVLESSVEICLKTILGWQIFAGLLYDERF